MKYFWTAWILFWVSMAWKNNEGHLLSSWVLTFLAGIEVGLIWFKIWPFDKIKN